MGGALSREATDVAVVARLESLATWLAVHRAAHRFVVECDDRLGIAHYAVLSRVLRMSFSPLPTPREDGPPGSSTVLRRRRTDEAAGLPAVGILDDPARLPVVLRTLAPWTAASVHVHATAHRATLLDVQLSGRFHELLDRDRTHASYRIQVRRDLVATRKMPPVDEALPLAPASADRRAWIERVEVGPDCPTSLKTVLGVAEPIDS